MALLTPEQIDNHMKKLPVEWSLTGGAQLELNVKFEDFATALAYVNSVGAVAESIGHHPDIQLGWGSVILTITTHSEGGLTKKDFEFAEAVQEINQA